MTDYYNILSIIRGTTVDGPGFRTSIYISGCNHGCPGCHNPQSWSFSAGNKMSLDEIMEIVQEEDFDVTLSGGDPLCNPDATFRLVEALKENGRNIWLYTGFTWEEIIETSRSEQLSKEHSLFDIVRNVDVLVDGPFIESLRDPDLLFRGSSNQRLIDVKSTLLTKDLSVPVLYK